MITINDFRFIICNSRFVCVSVVKVSNRYDDFDNINESEVGCKREDGKLNESKSRCFSHLGFAVRCHVEPWRP